VIGDAFRRRPVLSAAETLLLLLALLQTGRLAGFMLDADATLLSLVPQSRFLSNHLCFTAYYEGARLAGTEQNLYLLEHYRGAGNSEESRRKIDRFNVDLYQYPPPFLLLPKAVSAATGSFLRARLLWTILQAGGALLALLGLAAWIGGREGMIAALLVPAVWLTMPFQATLQIGNFQLAAFAACILAMILFARDIPIAGGALLSFAIVSKIFPGILLVWLIVRRDWKAALWTAVWAAAWCGLGLAVFGPAPFSAFLGWQLPRIESGEAFPMLTRGGVQIAINHSITGAVLKLAALGVPAMTLVTARIASWLWTLGLLAAVVWVGRGSSLTRLQQACCWLALLGLASLRSPFVPQEYAFLGPVWLLPLLAAGWGSRSRVRLFVVGAFVVLAALLPHDTPVPPPVFCTITTLQQIAGVTVLLAALALVAGDQRGGGVSRNGTPAL